MIDSSQIRYRIRSAGAADVAYITDSWLKSHNKHTRPAEWDYGYAKGHRVVVNSLMQRALALVAMPEGVPIEDQSVIMGWCCYEPIAPRTLHYVFVRPPYRRAGVARALVTEALGEHLQGLVVTHGNKLARRKGHEHGWVFAPRAPLYRAIVEITEGRR